MTLLDIALAVPLGLALAIVTREWLVLRGRQRQRGLFRRWPIPSISVEGLDSRFAPDELGATRAAEVSFVGRGTIRVPGGTSDAEAWILAVLAKDTRRLFEFGTCTGKTAYLWARNQPPDGRVITLTLGPDQLAAYHAADGDDTSAELYARQESRFDRFLYSGTEVESRVTQLYGDSKSFDETPYAGSCDVVFVDGSHAYSYVVSDSTKALRLVRPGGLVLWHDYSPECPGVFRALNELARRLSLQHIRGTTLVVHRA
ncbi:MAG: class I SAM-dependent methyltransferase [Gemmatimonadales bacterium]|nr:class I SAM-dependent methyltransferase [Gemmatimonadales bacterium]